MHDRRRSNRPTVLLVGLLAALGLMWGAAAGASGLDLFQARAGAPAAAGTAVPGGKAIGGTQLVVATEGGSVYYNQGVDWVDLEYPSSEVLNGIDALSLDNLWVCGEAGVRQYDGQGWGSLENLGQTMNTIMVRPDGVVAVGNNGLVMRNTGTGWANLGSGTLQHIEGVWGPSAHDFWVCGTNGTIRRYRNGQWNAVASGTGFPLMTVWGAPGVGPFFGGGSGTLLEYRDGDIVPIVTGNSSTIYSIHGTGSDNVWAAGFNGWVWFYDGEDLTTPTPGGTDEYRAIWAYPSGLAAIGGVNGVVRTYNGDSWSSFNLPVAERVFGMIALPSTDNAGWWDGFARAPRGLGLSNSSDTPGAPNLVSHDGKLYVHGFFDAAGELAVQNIAAFGDDAWTSVPGLDGPYWMFSGGLDVFQGDLVAATRDDSAGSVQRLNGESWEPLGVVPLGTISVLRSLELGGQERLVIAGILEHPDFPTERAVFYWDPPSEQWLPIGPGLPVGEIYGLVGFEGDLYVAILDAHQIYRIEDGDPDGTWELVYEDPEIWPLTLLVHEGQLYVGCYGTNIDALRRYVPGGSLNWEGLGAVISGPGWIFDMTSWGDRIVMVGSFSDLASTNSRNAAYWEAGDFHPLGLGISAEAWGTAVHEDDLYIGGQIHWASGRESLGLARWRDPADPADTAPVVTLAAPNSFTQGQPATFAATVESYQTVHSVTLTYRGLDTDDFTHRVMEPQPGKSTGFFQTTIPGAEIPSHGLQHFVTVQTDQVTVTVPPNAGVAAGYTGVGVTFLATQEVAGRYELFGIPYAPAGTMSQIFEGSLGSYDPSRWRLERWNPGTERYLSFPQVPAAVPGRGYYIIQRNPQNLTISGSTTSTVDGQDIQLEPGWNMIATPYLFSIPWTQVSRPTGVENQLIGRIDDAYVTQTVLEPWRGYFVYNAGATPVTMTIPALGPGKADAADAILAEPDQLPGCDWLIRITASQGERQDLAKTVGALTPGAESPGDLHQPPSLPHDLSVWLEREQDDGTHLLRRDLRDLADGQYWDLVVRPAESGGPVHLEFAGLADVPAGLQVALATPSGVQDLRRDGGQWQGAVSGETRLRLVVGDPALVEQAASSLPQPYALLPAYPNPFNPSTTVAFTLPRDSRVRIDVFDVAGRRVRTLVADEVLGAGRHDRVWDGLDHDGRSLSSGVYFARLQADGFGQTRKLTLVR